MRVESVSCTPLIFQYSTKLPPIFFGFYELRVSFHIFHFFFLFFFICQSLIQFRLAKTEKKRRHLLIEAVVTTATANDYTDINCWPM